MAISKVIIFPGASRGFSALRSATSRVADSGSCRYGRGDFKAAWNAGFSGMDAFLSSGGLLACHECGNAISKARPLSEYHEDMGPVVWRRFPVTEAPWIGSPLSDDWPCHEDACEHQPYRPYYTHWTPLPPIPVIPPDLPGDCPECASLCGHAHDAPRALLAAIRRAGNGLLDAPKVLEEILRAEIERGLDSERLSTPEGRDSWAHEAAFRALTGQEG